MFKCGDQCVTLCDFCAYYDFDDRFCRVHKETREPEDLCDDFVCIIMQT